MTTHSPAAFAVTVALLVTTSLVAPPGLAAAEGQGRYPDLLQQQGAAAVAHAVLAACADQTAEVEIQQLGNTLATSSKDAVAVWDALAAEPAVEAATVSAELLWVIAARIGGRPLTDDPGWQQLTVRGAALLDDRDPFVRGIAAWSLVGVRDANQDVPPSDASTPDWLAKCLTLQPENSLECDFVLQAIGLAVHRTTARSGGIG